MNIIHVKVKDLKIGDIVFVEDGSEDGSKVKITGISKGIQIGTLELRWKGGFSSMKKNAIVECADNIKEAEDRDENSQQQFEHNQEQEWREQNGKFSEY